ncbi:adenosine deaminase [Legionella dresdenensis]|uniref:adenosine deaminase n=2 Tax=Legionella dresdenensis TaxID=450200 RepID=A0ABV8CFM4_9GAMM
MPCHADVLTEFAKVKSELNALYAFLKDMPKGGELHYHLAGGAYPETMLSVAAKEDYCLNKQSLAMTRPTHDCTGIKSSDLTKQPELYAKTIKAWSMKDFIPGKESGHDHFFATFYKFMYVVADNHVPLLAEIMTRAANQNEVYMEIMVMPDNAKSTAIATEPVNVSDYDALRKQLLADPKFMAEIDNTVAKSEALLPDTLRYLGCDKNPGQPVCQLSVRFQYHVLREQPLEKVFPQALHAFEAAERSPAIVGVNLVQAEDGIISLRDYHEQMKIFGYMHKLYPNVRIALHAGELAMGDVMPENLRFHIQDAITTGHADRIGHGVDIAYENNAEQLTSYMAAKPIPVEVNLVSNQKILKVKGLKCPLKYYLAHQVPVVLSTDDEGVLRTDLTSQYVEAVMEHDVDYPTLKQISRNALTYSFLPGQNLWTNPRKATRVAACEDLSSDNCQQFVKDSEKARLQRQLELKFIEFEKGYK